MFVIEDPAGKRSERSKNLLRSKVLSHACLRAHEQKRARRLGLNANHNVSRYGVKRYTFLTHVSQNPSARSGSMSSEGSQIDHFQVDHKTEQAQNPEEEEEARLLGLAKSVHNTVSNSKLQFYQYEHDMPEGRSLQFFRERTAIEWAGWTDSSFWSGLVLQAVPLHPSIRHALVALGACHEMAEMENCDGRLVAQQQFAQEQGRKALVCLNKHHQKMTLTAMLSTYTAVASAVMFISDLKYHLKLIQLLTRTMDKIRAQPETISAADGSYLDNVLEPMIERLKARNGNYVDLAWGLRISPASDFFTGGQIFVPDMFNSTEEARETLETVLRWATYIVKTKTVGPGVLPAQAMAYQDLFLAALDCYKPKPGQHEKEHRKVALLRVACKLGFMMIRSIHIDYDDELFYDQFTPVYAELAGCFRQVIDYHDSRGHINMGFGTDVGILGLVGMAARRWCRDPSIRRELISLLRRSQRREAIEGAVVYAQIAEVTMTLEEKGLYPPPQTCYDIPLASRVRVNHIKIWMMRMTRVEFQVHPFGPDDVLKVEIPHSGCGHTMVETMEKVQSASPNMITGKGFTSFLVMGPEDEYYTVKDPKWFFPVPTV